MDYRRPRVEAEVYVEATGAPIPYGARYWVSDERPPDRVYGQCRHPERFAAVPVVAAALLDHLAAAYDVERTDTTDSGHRVATLTPRGAGAVIVATLSTSGLPGVELRAGHRFEASWPDCGCDACDDSVPDLLDDLEEVVLTIVEGGLSEWRSGAAASMPLLTDGAGRPMGADVVPWQVHHRLEGRIESESASWGLDEPEPVELPWTPHRWPAWPLRGSA